jgi:uncharacterized protein with NRDE domain
VCTLALYFRLVDHCPVIVAANRDEHYDRPSAPPGLWSTEPKIVAGTDLLAGGTWLGVNEHGLLVGILNRRLNSEPNSLTHTRSRGLLCLDLLTLKSAADAYAFVNRHEEAYQPFTIVFVDPKEAWIAYNVRRQIKTHKLEEGLHVYSSAAEFSMRSEKVDRAHMQFAQVFEGLRSNGSEKSVWVRALRTVLGDHTLGNGSNDPRDAICVHGDVAGTVSSTIIFHDQTDQRFYTFNCPGTPCRGAFGEALVLNVR